MDLAKEFAKAARIVKQQTKEQERKVIEDWIINCTERDLQALKKQALELFKAYNHQQEMLEISMMQNLIGTYSSSDSLESTLGDNISYPLTDGE